MSTKIYDAFITNKSFFELHSLITKFQQTIKQMIDEDAKRTIAQLAIHRIDTFYLKEEKPKKFAKYPLYDINRDMIEDSGILFDYHCDICLYPLADRILGQVFSGRKEYTKIWFEYDGIVDYHYQDQTDIPENITNEEWEQRRKDWDTALPDDNPIPCKAGYVIECGKLGKDFYPYSVKELTKYVPNFESRCHDLATDALFQDYSNKDQTDVKEILKSYSSYCDFLKTKEGQIKLIEKSNEISNIIPFAGDQVIGLSWDEIEKDRVNVVGKTRKIKDSPEEVNEEKFIL